jgi:hypothetical protein
MSDTENNEHLDFDTFTGYDNYGSDALPHRQKKEPKKITQIICMLLSYAQVVFSICMTIGCFACLYFITAILWLLTTLAFLPQLKANLDHESFLYKHMIDIRVVLLILAWFSFCIYA